MAPRGTYTTNGLRSASSFRCVGTGLNSASVSASVVRGPCAPGRAARSNGRFFGLLSFTALRSLFDDDEALRAAGGA